MSIRARTTVLALVLAPSPLVAQGGVSHYCQSGVTGARISVSGSASFSAASDAGDLVLHATPVPPSAPGLFLFGSAMMQGIPFGQGFRCVSGVVHRLPILATPPSSNAVAFALDYLDTTSRASLIAPGSSWNFQYWFRKSGSFDLSDALTIEFGPPVPITGFTTITQGVSSGFPLTWGGAGELHLIADAASWSALFNAHVGSTTPIAPPFVDFSQEVVLAAFAGLRATGGYTFAIRGLEQSIAALDVETLEHQPGPSCPVTFAITSPFHFVRFPRSEHLAIRAWTRHGVVDTCP